eukprot:TRINITY_DN62213_c0_g1_i1.p1 TRINITY_DN62213_c0_g1~~TRINITY_DN62213_c0_g1_i1.p1  ORF type:complete len:402 (+),score=21.44 TRINITY_DN62213_c0_g1_i1:36-1208(+)
MADVGPNAAANPERPYSSFDVYTRRLGQRRCASCPVPARKPTHRCLCLCLIYCAVLFGFVPMLIFLTFNFHSKDSDLLERLSIHQYERVSLNSRDSLSVVITIAAIYFPSQFPDDCPDAWAAWRHPSNSNATVIAQHGLSGSALRDLGGQSVPQMAIKPLLCAGFNVLAPDMRNHGNSGDSHPVTSGYAEADDILEGAQWLHDVMRVPHDQIFLWGQSLGAATVAHAAARDSRFRAIAIECPPVSVGTEYGALDGKLPGWLRRWFAWWHKTLSIENPFNEDLLREARHITADVFHSHGYQDPIVPFRSAELLRRALQGRAAIFDSRTGVIRSPSYSCFFHDGAHVSSWKFANYTERMLELFTRSASQPLLPRATRFSASFTQHRPPYFYV